MASSSAAIKQGSKAKKWVVGIFYESKEYSAVPTNWLLKTTLNGRTTISCKWPPSDTFVTSDLLKTAVDPSPDWPTYSIRLANNGKEYTNFSKAWHQKVQINSEPSLEFDAPKRKKYKNDKPLFQSFSEESDSSTQEGSNIVVPIKKSTPKTTSNVERNTENKFGNITSFQNQSNDSVEVEHYTQSMMTPSTSTNQTAHMENSYVKPTSNIEKYITNGNGNITALHSQSSDNIVVEPYIPSILMHALDVDHHPENESNSANFVDLNDKNLRLDKLEQLLKEQHNLQMMLLEQLLLKTEKVENYLKNKDSSHQRVFLDDEFLVHFPMTDQFTFSNVENLILNNTNFTEKLEYFIKTIGSANTKDYVKRVLGKLFKDEYAIKCTWTGQGKEIVTKVGDSAIIKIVKKIINECSKTLMTDSEFEKYVSDWFRYASSRNSRAQHN